MELPYRLTPRGMRRTFQDLARAAQVQDLVTRSVSGHATEQMQSHYSTVNPQEQRASLGRVFAVINGGLHHDDQGGGKSGGNRCGIRIPADFTERALKKEPVKIEFFKTGTSADQSAAMIELRVFRAVLSLNSDLVQLASSGGDRAINEVELVKLQAQPRPVTLDTSFAGRNPIPSGFNHSLPANMVMFLMINLLVFGGASVSTERESGVIRRLAVYPIARGQLILGKVYGRFLLGVFQITVFLLAGAFLFDVPVGNSPLALVVGLCLFAWVAASLGVLIGSLITGEEKTIGVCVVSSLVMGAMGGCWWPMEIVPETMQKVAHLVPAAWAMDLLHQVISFGGGFGDVLPEIFALLGFAVGFNLLAARFFRV
jgi:ABC-type multidrug transport system permease subunit